MNCAGAKFFHLRFWHPDKIKAGKGMAWIHMDPGVKNPTSLNVLHEVIRRTSLQSDLLKLDPSMDYLEIPPVSACFLRNKRTLPAPANINEGINEAHRWSTCRFVKAPHEFVQVNLGIQGLKGSASTRMSCAWESANGWVDMINMLVAHSYCCYHLLLSLVIFTNIQ